MLENYLIYITYYIIQKYPCKMKLKGSVDARGDITALSRNGQFGVKQQVWN